MRILFIRHAEPDYSIDSLTPKGWKEAEILSHRLSKLDIKAIYCSPLGRAKDTASFTLKALGREAEILPWLREFPCRVPRPDRDRPGAPWDLPDSYWSAHPLLLDRERWTQDETMQGGDEVAEGVRQVWDGLDALLLRHGYKREGLLYRPLAPNRDTILVFCHLGVQFVMLSHLMNVATPVFWQTLCVLPSSVTTVCTQHREKDICCFRTQGIGDLSHLYAENEPPSSMGFFSEVFTGDPWALF